MNDSLEQLLLGLAANGITELCLRISGPKKPPGPAVEAAIERAFQEVADVPAIGDGLGGERCREFLASIEAAEVVRQVFSVRVSSNGLPLEAVRKEFVALWRFRVGSSPKDREGERLFQVLLAACDAALEAAVEAGSLAAAEARSSRRHGELMARLGGIDRVLELLGGKAVPSPDEVEEFAGRYRAQFVQREGTIVPPDFDSAEKVPLDQLYVAPRFLAPQIDSEETTHRTYTRLVDGLYRTIVLGNPGSGKSTLAKKVGTDVADNRAQGRFLPEGTIAFLVVLRDFAKRKKAHECSIREFIEVRSESHYQVMAPPGAVEYLLATGRALVVFDGLDELLDTADRQEIAADIESFASFYPASPILVTSRAVGYEQAPLDPETFTVNRLDEFDEKQVAQYVEKWFGRDASLSTDEKADHVESFVKESHVVPDLRSNPLMLALMCNLYRGAGYIPRNRPDVYEQCALMLFDRWDRQRQIRVPLQIESHLRPAMQFLAHWIYTEAPGQEGVPEGELASKATEYLVGRRYDDEEEARAEARRFIEFCRGRAWVFTDTGTTASGEHLYQFTHRTFLEYFAAAHLVRVHPNPEALSEVLFPRIGAREWDVVAQLAFQMLDRNFEDAGTTLLKGLVAGPLDPANDAQGARLEFSCRVLSFLVPTPAITRRITQCGVQRSVAMADELPTPPRGSTTGENIPNNPGVEALEQLASASPENEASIVAALEEELAEQLQGTRPIHAAELASGLAEPWSPRLRDSLFDSHREVMLKLARTDPGVSVDLVSSGGLDVTSLVEDHGLEGLFGSFRYLAIGNRLRTPLADRVVTSVMFPGIETAVPRQHALAALGESAVVLETNGPPWPGHDHGMWGPLPWWAHANASIEGPVTANLTDDQWFALSVLSAAVLDQLGPTRPDQCDLLNKLLRESDNEYLDQLGPLLLTRIDSSIDPSQSIKKMGLSAQRSDLLLGWAHREEQVFVPLPDDTHAAASGVASV